MQIFPRSLNKLPLILGGVGTVVPALLIGAIWYYVTPDGGLYRWLGDNFANDPLIEQLSSAAYADPSLLYDARASNVPAAISVFNGTLTINPRDGFSGKFYARVTVRDSGGATDGKMHIYRSAVRIAHR